MYLQDEAGDPGRGVSRGMRLGRRHLGQQPQYLPTARGFDSFLGLPFSVDDGLGFAPPCPPDPPVSSMIFFLQSFEAAFFRRFKISVGIADEFLSR